jgi:crotonobetainyl-CoA:carnitine CoA-transferase CaiB-like acyl-CoA transferase
MPWHPLDGVTVIDLTHVVAGPTATQMLSDLGAEVIKVERPVTGDMTRENAFLGPAMFVAANRNKKSVTVDLSKPAGQELVMRMVSRADVLVENMAPGDAEKFGITYERLLAANPRILYCSIESFGEGPYEKLPAFDPVVEAMTGLMSVTGFPPDKYVRAGVSVLDMVAGLAASTAIVAGLFDVNRNHGGSRIRVSLGDVGLFVTSYWFPYYAQFGKVPQPVGSGLQTHAPYQLFRTKDGYLYVTVTNDNHWKRFCDALGFQDLFGDERYRRVEDRTKRKTELEEELSRRFASMETEPTFQKLLAARVPAGPLHTIDEIFKDPHFSHRGILRECYLKGQKYWVAASPVNAKMEVPEKDRLPALGEHTNEVLASFLGLSPDEIAKLRQEKAI